MKLHFHGIAPDAKLKGVLLANGFEVATTTSKSKQLPTPDCKLLAFRPESPAKIEQIKKLRLLCPEAWIAVVIPMNWLKSVSTQNILLEHTEKNAIWIKELWEATFWLCLQQMLQQQPRTAPPSSEADQDKLKQQYQELSYRSKKLTEQLERDVALAASIHRSLLPKMSPEIPGITLAVKYLPSAGLGGDYYDIFEFGDKRRFGVIIADSKSHGMAATLLSVLLKVRLDEVKDRFPDSRSFLEHIHREMTELHKGLTAPMSLLYGILDRVSLQFRFTTAGDIHPLLWRKSKFEKLPIIPIPPMGSPALKANVFREVNLQLKPCDLLFFHTDGLLTPLKETGRAPLETLEKLLSKDPMPDPFEVRSGLLAILDKYRETKPLEDDCTIIQMCIDQRTLYVAQG